MSEILLYKASLCIKNLDEAEEVVGKEIRQLGEAHDKCVDNISKAFNDVLLHVERRKAEVLKITQKICDEKKKSLQEQLLLIETEKRKVEDDCRGLQQQVDVRNITTKIGDLNEKLDTSTTLMEPREKNAFLHFSYKHNSSIDALRKSLDHFGKISISKTFPALCTANLITEASVRLNYNVLVSTVDYHGNVRTSGGDPVEIKITDPHGSVRFTDVIDNEDGTYAAAFSFFTSGSHKIHVNIFNRHIKDSPFSVNVSQHIDPITKFGASGSGLVHLKQPVSIFISKERLVYVLDTGNSRVLILDENLSKVQQVFTGKGLEQHSTTGMCYLPQSSLLGLVNWRTKQITFLSLQGKFTSQFTSEHFNEPIAISATSKDEIVVADNGVNKVFVFDMNGKLLTSFGSKGNKPGQFQLIYSVYVVPHTNEIIVCDNRLQVFTKTGQYMYDLSVESTSKVMFGGACYDGAGKILATRLEKGRCVVQVYDCVAKKVLFEVDSFHDRLKRPSGLSTMRGGYVFVVDLGNDCVKKYRYL